MEHINLKDQLNESVIIKIYYYIGALKPIPKQYTYKNKYRYGFKLRLIHPLTWVNIIYTLIRYGLNSNSFKEIKKQTIIR